MARRAAQGTGNIAQKGGSFNIGVEGQFLLGAAAASLTGIYVTGLPSFLNIPLCLLAATLAGALYSFIPTVLHIKRGASLLMIFLLMNSIATFLMQYVVLDRFASKDSLVPSTDNILATAELPYLIRRPNKLSSGILVVLLCAVILYFFYQKTTAGYDRKGGITVNGTFPYFLPIVLSIIRLSTLIFVACMGNMFCERIGALNLGSEGMMVSGAFCATLGSYLSGSAWIGVLCGMAGGVIAAMVHAVVSIEFGGQPAISGLGLNMFAIGLTTFLPLHRYFQVYHLTQRSRP